MRYSVYIKLRKDFIEVRDGVIVVGVKSPPEKGRANEEAIEKIAEYFDVPKSAVRILAGVASRRKIIEIL